MKTLRMIIACVNANGESDFFYCKVEAEGDQIKNGDHYCFAESIAEAKGYEHPMVSFDENDSAVKKILPLFNWNNFLTYRLI